MPTIMLNRFGFFFSKRRTQRYSDLTVTSTEALFHRDRENCTVYNILKEP